jgi:hypothetical protein
VTTAHVSAAGVEERIGQQQVLRDGHGRLEHPVDEDHAEAGELRRLLDALDGHLADMRDELDAEPAGLTAPIAAARVERRDLLLAGVERPVHRHDVLEQSCRLRPPGALRPRVEEGCVALDLERRETGGGVDDRLE